MALAFAESASRKIGGALPAGLGNTVASLNQTAIALLIFKSFVYFTENLIDTIQFIGSIYIAYIGYNFIRHGEKFSIEKDCDDGTKHGIISRFSKRFLITFFNPKAILFFVALFPKFTESIHIGKFIELSYLFFLIVIMALACFLLYGFLGHILFKVSNRNYIINILFQFYE